MDKNNRYTNAPADVAQAMKEAVPIDNFLPPPEELIFREDNKKVTLALSRKSLYLFRKYAKKHGGKYQNMIRRLVDTYADKVLSTML